MEVITYDGESEKIREKFLILVKKIAKNLGGVELLSAKLHESSKNPLRYFTLRVQKNEKVQVVDFDYYPSGDADPLDYARAIQRLF